MNQLAGKPWSPQEDEQLIKEYTNDKLGLLRLCEIHKRNPGGITSRLKRLNLINIRQEARGYEEFINSDLYKDSIEKKMVKLNPIPEQKEPPVIFGLDRESYPLRIGQRWTEEEVNKLLKNVARKKTISEIANIHERTEGGIIGKLCDLAADYFIYENREIKEIQRFTGLSEEMILESINKKRAKKHSSIEKHSEPSLREMMGLMLDIQKKVDFLLKVIQ
jgi:hypothetical protein